LKKSLRDERGNSLSLMKMRPASEVYRIILLGLTMKEARAWYVNRILIPRFRWALTAWAAGLVILLSELTAFGNVLEQNLVTHMIAHDVLLLLSGFLLAFGTTFLIQVISHSSDRLWRIRNSLRTVRLSAHALSISAFGSAAVLIGYWYLPSEFNAAATNFISNSEAHIAFLLAGVLIFIGASCLSARLELIALVIVGKALGLYGMFLLLTPWTVYSNYPAYEQVYAGSALLFIMLILDFTIMPLWLYNYFRTPSGRGLVGDIRPAI
jgi:hypothetical protein